MKSYNRDYCEGTKLVCCIKSHCQGGGDDVFLDLQWTGHCVRSLPEPKMHQCSLGLLLPVGVELGFCEQGCARIPGHQGGVGGGGGVMRGEVGYQRLQTVALLTLA